MILPVFLLMLYGLIKSKEATFKEGSANTTLAPDLIVGSDATCTFTSKKPKLEVVKFGVFFIAR